MTGASHDAILRVHAAAVAARLTDSRAALLSGLDPTIVAGLPDASSPGAQLLGDLGALGAMDRLPDGTRPLAVWLENAMALVGSRPEANIFRDVLASISPERAAPAWRAPEAAPRARSKLGLALLLGSIALAALLAARALPRVRAAEPPQPPPPSSAPPRALLASPGPPPAAAIEHGALEGMRIVILRSARLLRLAEPDTYLLQVTLENKQQAAAPIDAVTLLAELPDEVKCLNPETPVRQAVTVDLQQILSDQASTRAYAAWTTLFDEKVSTTAQFTWHECGTHRFLLRVPVQIEVPPGDLLRSTLKIALAHWKDLSPRKRQELWPLWAWTLSLSLSAETSVEPASIPVEVFR